MKIAIASTNYVSSPNAIPLAHHEVAALNTVPETMVMRDREASSIGDSEFVVIAASASYDPVTNFFKTRPIGASVIPGIVKRIGIKDISVLAYEPAERGDVFFSFPVAVRDLAVFGAPAHVVLANLQYSDVVDIPHGYSRATCLEITHVSEEGQINVLASGGL